MPPFFTADKMHLYRHPQIQTTRPFAFDIDEHGVIWQGSSGSLFSHDPRTGQARNIGLVELHGRQLLQTLCFDGKVMMLHNKCRFVTIYDPATDTSGRLEIPGEDPVLWFGNRLADRVLLYDRYHQGAILVLENLDEPVRRITPPWPDASLPGIGRPLDDGRILLTLPNPLRLAFFDPRSERFTDLMDTPYPDAQLSGSFAHKGVVYFADSAAGRLLAYDEPAGRWRDPIPTPDHGQVYGFIGGGFQHGSCGYFCLSTYQFPSRLDPEGNLITPEGWDVGVDGHYPRFMDRFLVFDAADGSFHYLTVPEQPDGIPLICYATSVGDRAYFTGYVIPHGPDRAPTQKAGDWLIWQSEPARVEPFDARAADKPLARETARRQARTAPLSRGLYVVEPTWCPAVTNLEGPSFDYSPGREQALAQRMAATDEKRYWRELADAIGADLKTDRQRADAVGDFVQRHLYYNPMSEPHLDPIACIEAGEGRCGTACRIAMRLLGEMGIEHREAPLRHHVVAEAKYDGAWHVLDPLICGGQQPQRDGEVLSVEQIQAEPYAVDGQPLECFAYHPEELRTADDFYILGYVFGEWGSMPYYSGFYGGDWDYPPTLPLTLPGLRLDDRTVRLRWAPSVKRDKGHVEYRLRMFRDRGLTQPVAEATFDRPHYDFRVPQAQTMYHYTVQAVDDHREKNADTWYPTRRGNVVLMPRDQYGWYGYV